MNHDAPATNTEDGKVELKPSAVENPTNMADVEKARAYFTDLELVTQDGETVKFFDDILKDKIVVINFIFTNCEGACPLATQKLSVVRDMMKGQTGDPMRFVSISLDPERDSPSALRDFAKKYHADEDGWIFLTGNLDNVTQIIKKLGQFSPSLEDHSTLMLAGDVRTARWMKIPPQALPVGIVEKLRMLLAERS
jgi:cytochrome oxidase Cu insertion factor (SCO1/SenC/PrrC family)